MVHVVNQNQSVVLILCGYPLSNPRHGGQIRASRLRDKYRSLGYQVHTSGIFSGRYPEEPGFLDFPPVRDIEKILPNFRGLEDYVVGLLPAIDDGWFEKLRKKIPHQVDIIHIEQPWFFLFAERLAKTFLNAPLTIYGSQNIEHALKETSLGGRFSAHEIRERVELVRAVEIHAGRKADAVIAVSPEDALWAENNGSRNVKIVPNGVSGAKPTNEGRSFAKSVTENRHFCIFIGSAHEPNLTGFFEILEGGFGCLKPDEILVVVGQVSHLISKDPRFDSVPNLRARTCLVGEIDDESRDGLIAESHAVLLPITSGAGTMLKTAEAIHSGKHVIATEKSMRGFGTFSTSPGIAVVENAVAFKREVRRAMDSPLPSISKEEREKRDSLLWESCLGGVEEILQKIEKSN